MGTQYILRSRTHVTILAAFVLAMVVPWIDPPYATAFPDNPVLDAFTGTDNTSPPNSNWTNAELRDGSAGLDLEDNAAAPSGSGGVRFGAYYNATTYGPDSEAYGTMVNAGSTVSFGVCVGLLNIGTATTDGYCAETEDAGDTITLYRLDDTVATSILGGMSVAAVGVGDQLGIKRVGSQVCAWFNDDGGGWVEMGCTTDSTYTGAGHIGLYINGSDTVGAVDDFGGGTVNAVSQLRRRLQ